MQKKIVFYVRLNNKLIAKNINLILNTIQELIV